MNNSLLHISIHYSSVKWHILLKNVDTFLSNSELNLKGYLLYFDKQKGDAIKFIFSLKEDDRNQFEVLFRSSICSFLEVYPSVRIKKDFVPGEYLWKIKLNNTIEFEYFNFGNSFIDYNNQCFIESSFSRFGQYISAFILKTPINNKNVLDVFSFLLLLTIKAQPVKVNSSIFSGFLETVEEQSEFRQQREQLQKIYDHAEEDLQMNCDNIDQFICKEEFALNLEQHEIAIIQFVKYIFYKQIEVEAIAVFTSLGKIIIQHLGIDYQKQLYVLKIFHLFYEKKEGQKILKPSFSMVV